MKPSPDQEKQRALAWALYLVTGQRINLAKAGNDRTLPESTRAALRKVRQDLDSAEWQIRNELAKMVRRSLKGL
jgi:hypothetical protein